jgi:haloacetate dehalogenase
LLGADPDFYLKSKLTSWLKSKDLKTFDPRALAHYLAAFRDPLRIHAMCEDYRAGAYADFEHDRADREAGKKITVPMLALWGDSGIAQSAATPLDTWQNWATDVRGMPVDAGHFLTEEAPDATAAALLGFFAEGA